MTPIRIFAFIFALSMSSVAAQVVCEETDDHLIISRAGKHVLTYHKTVQLPNGVDPKYARSGFIHPISTPSSRVITDDYPVPHHAHQHGLFFAWKKAEYRGEKMNFWEPGKQSIRHEKVLEVINDKEAGGFRVELAHLSEDEKILREIWTVKVDSKTGFIDLTSEQNCATKFPITLEKYHYGAMAIRGSRQWFSDAHTSAEKGATKDEFVESCRMLTDEGLTQKDGNHSRPKWVCMTGPVNGAVVSITMIPHPTNFRYPQHVRLHPKMPYFCFIPTVEEPFQIEPGKPWISRYRIIAEDDEPDAAKLNKVQEEFASGM